MANLYFFSCSGSERHTNGTELVHLEPVLQGQLALFFFISRVSLITIRWANLEVCNQCCHTKACTLISQLLDQWWSFIRIDAGAQDRALVG